MKTRKKPSTKPNPKLVKNLKPVKPGEVRGQGRPPLTAEEKEVAIKTRSELSAVMMKYATLNVKQIDELLENPDVPVLDKALLKNFKKANEEGSMERTDWIMNHIMGPQAKKIDITTSKKFDPSKYTDEELKILKELAEK